MPLPAVQALLGHAKIEMTMRYAHLAPTALTDAVSILERAIPLGEVGQPVGNNPSRTSEIQRLAVAA